MFLTYQEYSRRMQHFTSPPIEWCHIKKKFVFVSGQFKSYLWYFHIFVGLGFCTVGGLIVILLSQIFKFYQAFHAVYIFIFVVQLSSGGAIFAMNLGMMLYGSDCVQGWNTLVAMEAKLQGDTFYYQKQSIFPHQTPFEIVIFTLILVVDQWRDLQ